MFDMPMMRTRDTGSTLTMTLVFVVMFAVVFAALAGLVSRTYHESVLQAQDETAFQVAEAGLNYARWRLAHNPDDYAPAERQLVDQFAGVLGTYSLTFATPYPGSTLVAITSVGKTKSQPARQVTLRARYAQPSLARYASITNDDVWYGSLINGMVHANGGIRMDGSSSSLMTSARETYACQPKHGCSSPYQTKPGIWGTGTKAELWEYPVVPVDYNALSKDLLVIKEAAVGLGTYYGPSGAYGYQIVFNSNNTYTISRVTNKTGVIRSCMYQPNWQCGYFSHDVSTTANAQTAPVPANGVIYIEDTVWVRGDIRSRVTLAAGVFPDQPATNSDIILNGNISYGGVRDASRVFGAVAQRHVLIPYSGAPSTMQLDGAFVAQKGSFHRRYYPSGPHQLKESLTRYGMVASNGVPGTAWISGGQIVSGFKKGSGTWDPHLLYNPPPYFPTSGQYEFISWEEEQ